MRIKKVIKILFSVILLIIIILIPFSALIYLYPVEIDLTSIATHIIDGDTFDINTGDRIRLADIDAPERGYAGYDEATNFLNLLIYQKKVYLDIDDVYMYDTYGRRLVCMVYIDYNSTHLLNVNMALLVGGFTDISNYPNEFNPINWNLYELKLLAFLISPKIIGFIVVFILIELLIVSAFVRFLRKIRKFLPF